jgi:hypothetical protein
MNEVKSGAGIKAVSSFPDCASLIRATGHQSWFVVPGLRFAYPGYSRWQASGAKRRRESGLVLLRSFPRKRVSSLGPRFRGDERKEEPIYPSLPSP